MRLNNCLSCNRTLSLKQQEEVWAALAKQLSNSRLYPRMYRLFGMLPLCAGCLSQLPILEGVLCLRCGRSLQSWSKQGELCSDCKGAVDDPLCCNRSFLRYEGWVKERMGTFKYRGDERWAHCFALLMAIGYVRHFLDAGISLISYVPLHEKRLDERGFNQAELLAVRLGRLLNVPVRPILKRIKETDKQSKKSGAERVRKACGMHSPR